MRPICALFCTLAFLSVAISAAKSELRDQTGSLGWQPSRFPNMKPAWNIPAGIFAPRGEAEKGVGQRFESDDGSRPVHLRTRERGGRYTFQLSQEESTAAGP
jgi:hypothetical protein